MNPFLDTTRPAPRRVAGAFLASTLLVSGIFVGAARAQQGASKPAVTSPLLPSKPATAPTVEGLMEQVRTSPLASVRALREEVKTLKAIAVANKKKRDEAHDRKLRAEGKDPEKEEAAQQAREAQALKQGKPLKGGDELNDEFERMGLTKLEAVLHALAIRAYPNDTIDGAAIVEGMAHRDTMPVASFGRPGGSPTGPGNKAQVFSPINPGAVTVPTITPTWQFLGPRNGPAGDFSIAVGGGHTNPPISGRVNAVVFDPTHPGTCYLVGSTGGLWKSTDRGFTWVPLSNGPSWPTLAAGSIALNPVNGNTVLVGTGDYDGFDAYGYGVGLMRSTDGGLTWTNVGRNQMRGLAVSGVTIDRTNPLVCVATTGRGPRSAGPGSIFRSTDGGATWSRVANTPQGDWSSLTVGIPDPVSGKQTYYASLEGAAIFKSVDAGATWTLVNAPINFSNQGGPVGLRVAASKFSPTTVYMIDGSADLLDGRIYRSQNSGATWTDVTGTYPVGAGYDPTGALRQFGYNWSQCWYDLYLSPSVVTYNGKQQESLFGAGITLGYALNGGTNFTDVGLVYATDPDSSKTHADQHNMAFDPASPNRLIAANDGGIYEMLFNPLAGTWIFQSSPSLNATLGVTQLYRAGWHPTNPDIMVGAAQDNGTPTSNGDLQNWINPGLADGTAADVNPFAGGNQYVATYYYGFIFRTNDGWATKSLLNPPFPADEARPFFNTLKVVPNATANNYALIGTQYLWVYNNATDTWTARVGNKQLTTDSVITAIGASTSTLAPYVVYVGTGDGKLWMTPDWRAGKWFQIDHPLGGQGIANRAITSIDVRPNNAFDILVTVSGTGSGHVFRCTNTFNAPSGNPISFTDQSGLPGQASLPNIPVNDITRDPNDPDNTFYVGTDIGVFMTSNNGASWSNATTPLGLPNVQVNQIKSIPGTGYLNVATYGRGFWRIPLSNPQVVANPGAANLSYKTSITRNGGNIIVTVAITNAASAGQAANAFITSAALTAGGKSSTPIGLPISVGTIAPGRTVNATISFVSTANPGTLATFSATGSYTNGTFVVPSSTFRLP